MATIDEVIAVLEKEFGKPFAADSNLDALDLDSLEFLDLVMTLRTIGNIPDEEVIHLHTPADVARVIGAHVSN